MVDLLFARDVRFDEEAADLLGSRLAVCRIEIADDDRGAFGRESARGRKPNTGAAARNHGDLALQALGEINLVDSRL